MNEYAGMYAIRALFMPTRKAAVRMIFDSTENAHVKSPLDAHQELTPLNTKL